MRATEVFSRFSAEHCGAGLLEAMPEVQAVLSSWQQNAKPTASHKLATKVSLSSVFVVAAAAS